ncbi:hypothetical protein [Streptomyces albicerus]|uniref:hypothetical protein n=1 Tax=Streptomyces albicerus TaxID=2569859 RepID=UPI00124B046C|nr:hypothetical protein [Streptomyces albicerus]
MSGSIKPKRRRAAGAALRYEHARERPVGPSAPKRKRNTLVGFVPALVITVVIGVLAAAQMSWGEEVWGDTAPDWPGGGYGFTATVGVLVPLAAAATIAPLTRMKWRKSRARALAWAAASLPGTLGLASLLVVILASNRPKQRRRRYSCYSEGGPCWVHEQYPYFWAVGLATTLLVAAALITVIVIVKRHDARRRAAADPAQISAA